MTGLLYWLENVTQGHELGEVDGRIQRLGDEGRWTKKEHKEEMRVSHREKSQSHY